MNYRVYLLDSDNKIRAAESFSAKDDLEAEELTVALYESCSTSFHGIELWRGSTVILSQTDIGARPMIDLQTIIDKQQQNLAEVEELLERGFECVRQSQQLMTALDKIRLAQPCSSQSNPSP